MQVADIHNTSSSKQVALVGGKQYVFEPGIVETLPLSIVERLVISNPHLEQVQERGVEARFTETPEEKMWIANVTGDKSLPEEIEIQDWDFEKRRTVRKVIPNGLREPSAYKMVVDLGQRETVDGEGKPYHQALGRREIIIPPFSSQAVPKGIAKMLLRRDQTSDPGVRGKLIRSRAKPEFWPDYSWEYSEIQGFLKLHEPDADLGASAEELVGANEEVQLEAKKHLLNQLFFIYANPDRAIFGRSEFNEYMAAQSKVTTKDAKKELKNLLK